MDSRSIVRQPEIARAQISPDGKFIAFLKPHKDNPIHFNKDNRRVYMISNNGERWT